MELVEECRIDDVGCAVAKVAQELPHCTERARNVLVTDRIDERELFARMRVFEGERARPGARAGLRRQCEDGCGNEGGAERKNAPARAESLLGHQGPTPALERPRL